MQTTIGGKRFEWGSRTYVMGIVNVTPDSFSGDGLGSDREAAVAQGLQMVEDGADILDVGGESTRPGHTPVGDDEEVRRTVPVVEALARQAGVPVSIDTSKESVARAAVDAGATIINDVWGLKRSPGLAQLAVTSGATLVLMHNQDGTYYEDLVADILGDLKRQLAVALASGLAPERVIVDPGIGFGKTPDQNIEVLRNLERFRELGHPILVGTSRKSFIGKITGLPVTDRVEGTAASVTAAVLRGADIVRVHDVKAMARVVKVADALTR